MSKPELILQNEMIDPEVRELIEQEVITPVRIGVDRSLRIKVTDNCGMSCTFCHNEGTPVTLDSQREVNGRVSIYESTNGVDFIAQPFTTNEHFITSLRTLREKLSSDEIHWTGGEPTLNPQIAELTRIAREMGYTVKMTSNGETGSLRMKDLAEAGLESINFSIFGTTPEEIAAVQAPRFRNPIYGSMKLKKLIEAIEGSIDNGIAAKANVVLRHDGDIERVMRISERFGNRVDIRLLPSLDDGLPSFLAVYKCLNRLGAKPVVRHIAAGSSNIRTDFVTPTGQRIGFKQINRVTLPETCSRCDMNNEDECTEGYYGVRLYEDANGTHKVGVCIQRMDLTVDMDTFIASPIADEIVDFRKAEYERLTQKYGSFIQE